jgi:hypothetical protein
MNQPQYTNTSSVPLSMAVFLATDHYDHIDEPNYISATSLIKPVRQLVLASRVPPTTQAIDLRDMTASRMGTALHDGIERAWKTNYQNAMRLLGYPKGVIDKVRINPTKEEMFDGIIPIYMEQRAFKKVGKYTIGGKYDFIGDGRLEDFKSTSVYTYIHQTNNEKYSWQGSIYRWLNPDLVTRDRMAIQFIFTDWSGAKARQDPAYPPTRTLEQLFDLKSIPETDAFVRRKLNQLDQYWDAPEDQIPECTSEDLWRSEPVFKYYKNPEKLSRSTKNFDNKQDAYIRLAEDGGKGVVIEKPGEVTACKYCSAFSVCTQKDRLIAAGDLLITTS